MSDAAPPYRVYDEEEFFSGDLLGDVSALDEVPRRSPVRRTRRLSIIRTLARRAVSVACGAAVGLGAVLAVRIVAGEVF
ncbi:MAG TPA: hypothetical protein VFW29_07605, partial [Solirubrobacteraceae bacterium]|nr:hypothetical protein [Solirubrobacteraceae bacterium]